MSNEQWITEILTAPDAGEKVINVGRNVVWREPDASMAINKETTEIRAEQVRHKMKEMGAVAANMKNQAPFTDVGLNAQQLRRVLAGAELVRLRVSQNCWEPVELFLATNEGARWALLTQVASPHLPSWRPEALEAEIGTALATAKQTEPEPKPEPNGDSWELAAWEVQVRDVMNAQLKDRNWQIRMDKNGEMWAFGLPTLVESQVWLAQHFAAIKVSDLFAVAPPVALDYRTYVLNR